MENQDLTGVVSGTSKDKQKDVSLASSTTASQFGSTGPRSDVSKELKNDQGLWVLPCPKDSPRPWVFIGFHPPKSLYSSALVPLGTKVPGILHEVASLAYHFSQWTQEDFYEEQVEPCIEPPVSQPPFGVQLSDSEFIPQALVECIQNPHSNYPILLSLGSASYICTMALAYPDRVDRLDLYKA